MARTKKSETRDEPIDPSHPFADTTDRFAYDALLRKHGFKIYSRPKDREPLWIKQGIPYSHSEALATLPKGLVRDAGYAEDVYLDGKIEE